MRRKKKKSESTRIGRPPKEISGDMVQKLAGIGCTTEEIAGVCSVSRDTIERRFRLQLELGRTQLRESLRRVQVRLALSGDKIMCIWLGKQYLGQREPDKASPPPADPPAKPYSPAEVTSEELNEFLKTGAH